MTNSDLTRITESAARAGIELDPDEARRWLEAATTDAPEGDLSVDARTGVFGHRLVMLDFSEEDLAHFRAVGSLVEIPDEEGVETALALSGSAAQSKIQTYPGDCDFFERVNIHAPTREEACARLGDVIRRKALDTRGGDTFRLIEVKFGEYPEDVTRGGETMHAGSPISWSPEELEAGRIDVQADGRTEITWDEITEPGWVKLDWVVADPVRRQVVNASNMIDATWEAPDGSITPLDGYLDPYFQEVYLNAEEVPLFSKLAEHVSADALEGYVLQLEKEVRKYLGGAEPNVGKAAKRMYNVFRMSGRYPEAAFLRELFDEPANVLYQIYAVVRTVEEASEEGSTITPEAIQGQLDQAILGAVEALEGVEEQEIVAQLLDLRGDLSGELDPVAIEGSRTALITLVNTFFREKLAAMPEVREYVESMSG
jgi:hypothetical protein